MKKFSFLGLAALFAFTLLLGSCKKDDPDPVSNKNASLAINGIRFQNLVGNSETYVLGYAKFDYFLADSSGVINDSSSAVNTFEVENPATYDQRYDFDMPANTKKFRVTVSFKVMGQGYAQSATVNQLLIKKSGATVYDAPLDVITTDNVNFRAEPQTVSF